MKYCHKCHRITAGKPTFCNWCGATYDVKLCPRLHVNPRAAQVCSQCGSHDLSTPQPRIPLALRPAVFLLSLGPGVVLLLLLLVWTVFFVRQLVADPNHLFGYMVVALILGLMLYGWMRLRSRNQHSKR